MDVNDQNTIRLGGSPTIGSGFFSIGYKTMPAPGKPVEPAIQSELQTISCQLEGINARLTLIYTYLTRPRWYQKLWSRLKGVFHVA